MPLSELLRVTGVGVAEAKDVVMRRGVEAEQGEGDLVLNYMFCRSVLFPMLNTD